MENAIKKIDHKVVLEFLTPILLVLAIFLLGLLIKGCFPFGSKEIGYIDFLDGYTATATSLWDYVHGTIDLTNWNWGGGANMFNCFVSNGFLSPINFVICLFPREDIIYALTFLIGIKLVLMAFTSYFCFKVLFKNVSKSVLCLFCLCWVFSGWTMVHFTNIGWLDLLIVLPLLVLAFLNMLKTDNIILFTLLLSYCLILSYYISYMIIIALFIVTLFYIIYLAKNRRKVATLFIVSLIIAVLISAVVVVPSLLCVLGAGRTSSAISTATQQSNFNTLFDTFFSKLSVLLLSVLPFVFSVRLLKQIKNDKPTVLFFLMSFICLSIGILIEPINTMWHGGSYYSFPFRYSFVIIFLLIFASLYYLNNFEIENLNRQHKSSKQSFVFKTVLAVICFIVFIVSVILFVVLNVSAHPYRPLSFVDFLPYLIMFVTSYYLIEYFLSLDNPKLAIKNLSGGILIFAFTVVQLLSCCLGFFGAQADLDKYRVINTQNIPAEILQQGYKLKDRENVYMPNYALITNYPSISNWIHLTSKNHSSGLYKLGYNTEATLIYSSGGTLLTDALLGNKYVLSTEKLNENFYNKLTDFNFVNRATGYNSTVQEKTVRMNLYELNFNLQPVFTTDVNISKLLSNVSTEKINFFEVQNMLYQQLFSQTDNVLHETEFEVSETEDSYLVTATAENGKIAYVSSNFEKVLLKNSTRYLYNGINDFGTVENGTVSVEISKNFSPYSTLTLDILKQNLKVALFDAEKFKLAYDSYQNCTSSIEINKGTLCVDVENSLNKKYAFIPYIYLNPLSATLNENSVKAQTAFDAFICIELENGNNSLKITSSRYGANVGAIISFVGISILILFAFLNIKVDFFGKRWFVSLGAYGWFLAFSTIVILLYLAPTLLFFQFLFGL